MRLLACMPTSGTGRYIAVPLTPTERAASVIRFRAAQRRVSQGAIAERLGLSQQAISDRFLGKTPFDINELTTISELLDLPISDLLGELPSGVSSALPPRPKRGNPGQLKLDDHAATAKAASA